MRIVAGSYRSRTLVAPAGVATRPTSDRLRETLFNVLAPRLPGARFADLYAGSGAVGLEALSRGASFACFAERAPAAVAAIRSNLAAFGVAPGSFALEARGVERLLAAARGFAQPWDLVFLDPPYEAAEEYTRTLTALAERHRTLLAPGALVIAEHARRRSLPEMAGVAGAGILRRTRLLEQGDAALCFFALEPEELEAEAQELKRRDERTGEASG